MIKVLWLVGVWLVSFVCFGYLFARTDDLSEGAAALFTFMIATGTTLMWASTIY